MYNITMLSKNKLKDIKGTKISASESAYPPILDLDAEFAAESLTIGDSIKSLELMKKTFDSIMSSKNLFPILEYTITFSEFNYEWFCTFTNRLNQIINNENLKDFPIVKNLSQEPYSLQVYPPFHRSKDGKVILDKFRIKSVDPINLHRVNYIRKDLSLEDFRDGFPNWYLLRNSTVFEQYNEVTNTRVRIDFRNGEFLYYISGASDNWKQIVGVPLEMDHVVSALLFRN